jgi:hypothetical protein
MATAVPAMRIVRKVRTGAVRIPLCHGGPTIRRYFQNVRGARLGTLHAPGVRSPICRRCVRRRN